MPLVLVFSSPPVDVYFLRDLRGGLSLLEVPKYGSQMFFKMSVLKNFAISTGKHLCWSLFLIKLQASNTVHIEKFLRTAFFYRTLLVAASRSKSRFWIDMRRS